MKHEQTTAAILKISDENTIQLIELYRQEECLWNTFLECHKNKLMRSEAAQNIADKLNVPNFTARHVMMKFKNLRNSYSQELKKIAKSKLEGDGRYQPTVVWFNQMDAFIRPHLQPPRGRNGGVATLVPILDGKETWPGGASLEEMLQSELIEETTPTASDNESVIHTRKRRAKNRSSFRKRTKIDSESDDQITSDDKNIKDTKEQLHEHQQSQIASALKDLAADVHLLMSQKEDYFDSFGKYIAGLLRSIPHKKALEVQPQIISLITAAGYGDNKKYDCDVPLVQVKVEKL